jgi:hypothetical protein
MFDTLDSIKDGKGGSNPFGKFGFDEWWIS